MIRVLLTTLGLLALGSVIVKFYVTDQIRLLVHPNYTELVLVSGIILLLLGGYGLGEFILGFHKKVPHSHEHQHSHEGHQHPEVHPHSHEGHQHSEAHPHVHLFSANFTLCLVLVPAFLAWGSTIQPLSSETALLRGVSQNVSGFSEQKQQVSFTASPKERTLLDWLLVLNDNPEPANHQGQSVQIKGIPLIISDLPKEYFFLGQFVMSCCVADARPVGLLVRYNPERMSLPNGEWIQIEGTMTEGTLDEQRLAVISLSSFKKIPTPKNPYISL